MPSSWGVKRKKNREDSSDFDDFLTKSIAPARSKFFQKKSRRARRRLVDRRRRRRLVVVVAVVVAGPGKV